MFESGSRFYTTGEFSMRAGSVAVDGCDFFSVRIPRQIAKSKLAALTIQVWQMGQEDRSYIVEYIVHTQGEVAIAVLHVSRCWLLCNAFSRHTQRDLDNLITNQN
jgi:hypothetical protein